MAIIGILAALLALFGFAGSSGTSTGSGTAPPPTTASTGPTCVDACGLPLSRVTLTWSGGFTGQAPQTVTVTDPARLAELSALVPTTLPDLPAEQMGCADCYSYRLEIVPQSGEARTYETDDANLPPSLEPLVRKLRDG